MASLLTTKSLAASAALALAPFLQLGTAAADSITLADTVRNDTITVEMTSVAGNFDGAKVKPGANDTSYDWWYFDAVSASNPNASVTVVMYNAGKDGFINPWMDGPLSASVTGSFPNGSLFSYYAAATEAVVTSSDEGGVSVDFAGAGIRFTGSPLTSDGRSVVYAVQIDMPDSAVKGTIQLTSTLPAHYPCARNAAGAAEAILPGVGWANAQPDAAAAVSLAFGATGDALGFTDGVGYHDKNWGGVPFVTTTSSWYWGHARFGPWSVVWFDALDVGAQEHFSAYVGEAGEGAAPAALAALGCGADAVVARPWGANAAYPPVLGSGSPTGFAVTVPLDDGRTLVANVSVVAVVAGDEAAYARFTGTVSGGVVGGEQFDGVTLCEQFKFASAD